MEKLTKSMSLFKERNCSVSIVLDSRTRRKNAYEFPLSLRFTIDRKFFYLTVGSSFTEKKFSDICNATKCKSENYKLQKEWKDTITPKYKDILTNLNKGGILTFEMVRQCIMGEGVVLFNEDTTKAQSFVSVWEQVIHELRTDDGGVRFTTAESYECSLKSFRKILGTDVVKGFCISAAEIQKWKEGMHNGVKDENGAIIGKISDTTAGIYLRCCRAVWNRCIHEGFLKDVPYPEHWSEDYVKRAHYSLGLFLAQYLCNGFNMADAGRLTYDNYYYQTDGKAFRFNRKKTSRRSADGSEVIVPIIPPLQYVLDEVAAPPTRGGLVFPHILKGAETEELRRKYTLQENSNVKDRIIKICHEALHWDKSIRPSGTWCRHSFATNLHNAGVDMDYISESMGHSSSDHAITQIYIEHYPLEIQMENNSKLLNLEESSARDVLLAKLASMSTEELAKLFTR